MCLDLRHSLGCLLPVALCGTEVAYRGCSALRGPGPALETRQPTSLLHTLTHLAALSLHRLTGSLGILAPMTKVTAHAVATGGRTCEL